MPTSNSTYDAHTTGHTVVSAYPDEVKDRIILITGANPGGIGLSSALSLAKASPKLLILAGRSASKLEESAKEIQQVAPHVATKHLILDLSSQASCRKAAQEVLDADDIPHLDLLINNAGVMDIEERTLSTDGIEMQFATNHVGHFLFTNLVLPKIITAAQESKARPPRIINLSSRAVMYGPVRFSDWNFTKAETDLPKNEHMSQETRELWSELEDKPYVPQAAYGQSKCANVLFTRELNKRLFERTGILSIAVHPGGIQTRLSRHIPDDKFQKVLGKFQSFAGPSFHMKNLDEGCSTTMMAALDTKLTPDDFFTADCQVAGWAPDGATNMELAERLWSLSESLVREQFL